MRNAHKNPFEGLTIPEPSADFERRILAAAKEKMAEKTGKPERQARRLAGFAAAMAATLAFLWVIPSPDESATVRGIPLLADVDFAEDADGPATDEELLADLL